MLDVYLGLRRIYSPKTCRATCESTAASSSFAFFLPPTTMFFRSAARSVGRSAARARSARGYSAAAEHGTVIEGSPSKEWVQKQAAIEHHAAGTQLLDLRNGH